MRSHITYSAMLAPFILLASAPLGALAGDVLKTNGYSSCQVGDSAIKVNKLDLEFDRSTKKITFDVSGTSEKVQKVMAKLVVNAYGIEVYKKEFNPCSDDTKVEQLCPVPAGTFSAKGDQTIPEEYLKQIPSIAFSVPDLDSQARLELTAVDGSDKLACITSQVSNGKTMELPGVSYVAAGIAGAALAVSGLSALASAGNAGTASASPTFFEVMSWFQTMALNGMMSVEMPGVYRSFSNNFAFSTGLIQWESMQISIDNFRNKTGGNLTENSVEFLKKATLVQSQSGEKLNKRGLDAVLLWARDELSTNVNGTESSGGEETGFMHTVKGIQATTESLMIPSANTFMTVLLIFAIVVAAIIVGVLLFKVILETWALFGSFPKRLTGFRKRYWWFLAKTVTHLILLLYGIWTLYCVYQFKNGDSWAAKTLAAVTLALFTAILAWFTWSIWSKARTFKKMEGDSSQLYENKEVWRKYNIFYENYKKGYWWVFTPLIIYMFARGCVIAGADGHGLAQAAGQLVVESLLLILILWVRPYSLKSGNWINISIQIVRVLSVVCILVFVEELGMTQTTKTVTGLVLVVMQAVLTGVLAILIAVNAIIICCKENPHKKKRKEAEKMRDLDNLTPLDARNSLLMDPAEYNTKRNSGVRGPFATSRGYEAVPLTEQPTAYGGAQAYSDHPKQHLLTDTASIGGRSLGHSHTRSISGERGTSPGRAPHMPQFDLGLPNNNNYGNAPGDYSYYGGGQVPQGGEYRGRAF